ncbi:unnamed protein product [Clonostachys rosea]|uniref:Aminoglycoside phosphotransferase domain-containing protein n=1 Tax=Bionectria ochroleuca TaxID=29856 RepID=A0ABY6V2A2_BIOOC|nr:unnamed protein product [Clonostachys rosea]
MVEFWFLSFDKIGYVISDNEKMEIGPCFDSGYRDDGRITVTPSGPYTSTAEYLQGHILKSQSPDPWNKTEVRLMELIRDCLSTITIQPGFTLTIPDVDPQNIMVNSAGTITGFIDLDLSQTMPRFLGYAKQPSWIARGLGPILDSWPTRSSGTPLNTPKTLIGT